MEVTLSESIGVPLPSEGRVKELEITRKVVGVRQFLKGLFQEGLPLVAEKLCGRLVDLDKGSLEAHQADADAAGLEGAAKALLVLPQASLDRAPLGEVGMGADDPQGTAVGGLLHDAPAVEQPLPGAVLAAHAVLILVGFGAAGKVFLESLLARCAIIRMQPTPPLLQTVPDLVPGVAEHALPVLRVEDLAGRAIPVPDPVACALEGEAPALFTLVQRVESRPPHRDIPRDAEIAHELTAMVANRVDVHLGGQGGALGAHQGPLA